jgi:hypothetical protein
MNRRSLAGLLLRCSLYGLSALLIWFVMFRVAGQWMYEAHRLVFGMPALTRHEFDLLNCCGLVLLKLPIVVAFVLPYLAGRFSRDYRPSPREADKWNQQNHSPRPERSSGHAAPPWRA